MLLFTTSCFVLALAIWGIKSIHRVYMIQVHLISVFCLLIGEISCTFSRSTKRIKCDSEECSAETNHTPIGTYKLGAVEWNSGEKNNMG